MTTFFQKYNLHKQLMNGTPGHVNIGYLAGVGSAVTCDIDNKYEVACSCFDSKILFPQKYSARIENEDTGAVTHFTGARARALYNHLKQYCK